MIAPDAQRHPVGGIREAQLAIRFLLARDFCRGRFHLHVNARLDRAVLRTRRRISLSVSNSIVAAACLCRRLGQADPTVPTLRFGDADHTAGDTTACIAGRLRFQSSAFSCTITPRPMIEFSPLIVIILSFNSRCALPVAVRLDVAEIAGMASARIRSAMRIFHRIEMAAGRSGIGRRAIAELMNVKSVFARE